MQVPFPELMHLVLLSGDETAPVFPDSFLDGSAPHLRSLALRSIPFPGLPRLLLSATNLAHLCLDDIPYSGYIPPEAMVSLVTRLSLKRVNHVAEPGRSEFESLCYMRIP